MCCGRCQHGEPVLNEKGNWTGEVTCKHPVLEPKDEVMSEHDNCNEYERIA